MERLDLSVWFDDDFLGLERHGAGGDFAAGPANLDLFGTARGAQNLHRAVLGPIAAAGMNFAHGPHAVFEFEPQYRAHSRRIAGRPFEPYPQSRLRPGVTVEFGFRSVLRHHQVHTPVRIVVAQRRAARSEEHTSELQSLAYLVCRLLL